MHEPSVIDITRDKGLLGGNLAAVTACLSKHTPESLALEEQIVLRGMCYHD